MPERKQKSNLDVFPIVEIGRVRTWYKQRFGIPRQPGLTPSVPSVIELHSIPHLWQSLQGLEGFSHLWVFFIFHDQRMDEWIPCVRPPRLDGRKKMGVHATRSPHRLNPIGISVVKLDRIEFVANHPKICARLHVLGGDWLDGTPIIDVKPYMEYTDSVKKTRAGWAFERLKKLKVVWTKQAIEDLKKHEDGELSKSFSGHGSINDPKIFQRVKKAITEIMALDPRPAFQRRRSKTQVAQYGLDLGALDLHYEIDANAGVLKIFEIVPRLNQDHVRTEAQTRTSFESESPDEKE